jgi:23S rRNA (uracil1939-C5)-methyltransferase
MGKTGEATVKKIVEGGLGLAFHDGKTLFIPFSAPGDRVEFSVTGGSGNILFSRIERIIEPSGFRIEPECPNFTSCPGCDFLHLSYRDELKIKQEMTAETFRRIGKSSVETDLIRSPERFGCRSNILFEFDGEGNPGLREESSGEVIGFPEGGCPLLSGGIREAMEELRGRSLRTGEPALARTDRFGATHFWGVEGVIEMPDILLERGGNLFPSKPRASAVDNLFLHDRLIEVITELPLRESSLTELYCGTGELSLAFASRGMEVTAIDEDGSKLEDARAAARLNESEGVEFRRGSPDRVLKRMRGVKSMLISPPPGGMPKLLIREILKSSPEEIIVDSFDAATMARDLNRLKQNGYSLSEFRMLDLHPGRATSMIVMLLRKGRQA